MTVTLQKRVRITAEQWRRIEIEAEKRKISPNGLLVGLAIEALDRREWPRTELEIHLVRSSIFCAQVLSRDLVAQGRQDLVDEIRRDISGFVPELPRNPDKDAQ